MEELLTKVEEITQSATSVKSATQLILLDIGQDDLAERLMKNDHTVLPAIRALSGESELEMIALNSLKEEMEIDIQCESDVERLVTIIMKDIKDPLLDKMLKYATHVPKPEDEDNGFDFSMLSEALEFCMEHPTHAEIIQDIIAFFLNSFDFEETPTGLPEALEKMNKAMNDFHLKTMEDAPTEPIEYEDIPTSDEESEELTELMIQLSTNEGKQEVLDKLTSIQNELEAVDVEANLEASDDEIADNPIVEAKLMTLPSIQKRLEDQQ